MNLFIVLVLPFSFGILTHITTSTNITHQIGIVILEGYSSCRADDFGVIVVNYSYKLRKEMGQKLNIEEHPDSFQTLMIWNTNFFKS